MPVRVNIASVAVALSLAAALPAVAQTSNSARSAQAPGAAAPTSATAPGALAVGQPVKDKTGVVIGEITDLKGQQATVKMGDQSFSIGAQSFVVQDGAAVINATQDQLKAMIANAGKPG
jgi:hypothetical protein